MCNIICRRVKDDGKVPPTVDPKTAYRVFFFFFYTFDIVSVIFFLISLRYVMRIVRSIAISYFIARVIQHPLKSASAVCITYFILNNNCEIVAGERSSWSREMYYYCYYSVLIIYPKII